MDQILDEPACYVKLSSFVIQLSSLQNYIHIVFLRRSWFSLLWSWYTIRWQHCQTIRLVVFLIGLLKNSHLPNFYWKSWPNQKERNMLGTGKIYNCLFMISFFFLICKHLHMLSQRFAVCQCQMCCKILIVMCISPSD